MSITRGHLVGSFGAGLEDDHPPASVPRGQVLPRAVKLHRADQVLCAPEKESHAEARVTGEAFNGEREREGEVRGRGGQKRRGEERSWEERSWEERRGEGHVMMLCAVDSASQEEAELGKGGDARGGEDRGWEVRRGGERGGPCHMPPTRTHHRPAPQLSLGHQRPA